MKVTCAMQMIVHSLRGAVMSEITSWWPRSVQEHHRHISLSLSLSLSLALSLPLSLCFPLSLSLCLSFSVFLSLYLSLSLSLFLSLPLCFSLSLSLHLTGSWGDIQGGVRLGICLLSLSLSPTVPCTTPHPWPGPLFQVAFIVVVPDYIKNGQFTQGIWGQIECCEKCCFKEDLLCFSSFSLVCHI